MRFRELSWTEKCLVLYSAWILLWTTVGLCLVPFYRLRQWIGRMALRAYPDQTVNWPTLRQLALAVELASRYVPHATCLAVALAGQVLLKHYGYPTCLHVGVVTTATENFEPHAWVESRGRVVIGDDGHLHQYRQIIPPPVEDA